MYFVRTLNGLYINLIVIAPRTPMLLPPQTEHPQKRENRNPVLPPIKTNKSKYVIAQAQLFYQNGMVV